LKKYAPWVVYPAFYFVMLLLFAVLVFPYDKLKERLVGTFNAQQRATNGHQELQIDEMTGHWVTGVKMKGVHLLSAASDPTQPPVEIKIEEATARVSMLGLLIGNQDTSFRLDAFGGTIKGSHDQHGKDRKVELELADVDVGQIQLLTDLLGLPMEGKLSGTISLLMPEGKASKGSGNVALEIKEMAVGDGKAKLQGKLALPRLAVGDLTLTAEAKDGVLKITKLGATGKDLELVGEGRIGMRDLATDSLADIQVRFKINDGYRTKNDITKSLFGAPGSNMPALFDLDPKVKQSKRTDGFYAWTVRGPLGRPDFVPAGGGGAAPSLGGSGLLGPSGATVPGGKVMQ
jgi:type II secretion system protein N